MKNGNSTLEGSTSNEDFEVDIILFMKSGQNQVTKTVKHLVNVDADDHSEKIRKENIVFESASSELIKNLLLVNQVSFKYFRGHSHIS